jgi:hypothetical protein
MTHLAPGTVVKFSKPSSIQESDLRFTVLEIHPDAGRVAIRATAESMPDWNPDLLPIEVVSISEVEAANV